VPFPIGTVNAPKQYLLVSLACISFAILLMLMEPTLEKAVLALN